MIISIMIIMLTIITALFCWVTWSGYFTLPGGTVAHTEDWYTGGVVPCGFRLDSSATVTLAESPCGSRWREIRVKRDQWDSGGLETVEWEVEDTRRMSLSRGRCDDVIESGRELILSVSSASSSIETIERRVWDTIETWWPLLFSSLSFSSLPSSSIHFIHLIMKSPFPSIPFISHLFPPPFILQNTIALRMHSLCQCTSSTHTQHYLITCGGWSRGCTSEGGLHHGEGVLLLFFQSQTLAVDQT